jgi:3-hydroxyacyl-CoA dehydrogenase/enoyl-CoA hydratase/3-hydroxybutyryl-CoA epimerase
MLTGRAIDARRAKRLGLVDAVTPRRHFENAARAILATRREAQASVRRRGHQLADRAQHRRVKAAKQVAEKARRDHYPAPYAIIETWRDFGGDVRNVPKDHPASMTTLFHHPTTRNLIRIFQLQDRLKALGKPDVAPGAANAAMDGGPNFPRACHRRRSHGRRHRRVVWRLRGPHGDAAGPWRPNASRPAIKRAAELYKKRLREPHLVQGALDRLVPDVKGNGVAHADLIIEAIVENAEVKRKVFAQVEPRHEGHAILASNTSSIPLQELASTLARPERLVGIHFFNPVPQMMLVEIVPRAADLRRGDAGLPGLHAPEIDKLPLPCKSATRVSS